MGEDIWHVLTVKLRNTSRPALVVALSLGGNALLRTCRAWHDMLRDSGGRVSDRKFRLYGEISKPGRAQNWGMVPSTFRDWERRVTEYENIIGGRLDEAIKCHAVLDLLPHDLRELAQSQVHLEQSYVALRDYILNQSGRKTTFFQYET